MAQDKITLTKAGKQSLHTIRVSVDDELNLIHAKVMKAFNDKLAMASEW